MHNTILLAGLVITTLLRADTKMAFTNLPAAVQTAAKAEAKAAEILGAATEIENGRKIYEVETKKDGKSRDLSFDVNGKLLESEQEVDLSSIPATAKAGLKKRAASGSIQKVECVTAGTSVTYEAVVLAKTGKHIEIAVNPDGSLHRD